MIKLTHKSTDKGFILEEINSKLIKKGKVEPLESEEVLNDPESVKKHIKRTKERVEKINKEIEKVALTTKSEDRAIYAESIKLKDRQELSSFLTKLKEQKIKRRIIPLKQNNEGYRFEVRYEKPLLIESVLEEDEEEISLDTYEDQITYLVKDEDEAIEGYEKVLNLIEDENVKEQLEKILEEEKAHKEFLEKVISDKSLKYSHEEESEIEKPLEDEEQEIVKKVSSNDEWNFEEEDQLAEKLIKEEDSSEDFILEDNKSLTESHQTFKNDMWNFGDEE